MRSENSKHRSIKLIKGDSEACQKDDKAGLRTEAERFGMCIMTIVWDNICNGNIILREMAIHLTSTKIETLTERLTEESMTECVARQGKREWQKMGISLLRGWIIKRLCDIMRNNRELSLLHSEIPSSLALLIHLPICLCDSHLGSPLCLGSPLFFYFLFDIPLNLHCFMMLMNPQRQNWSEKT